jgi:hypothetical protein
VLQVWLRTCDHRLPPTSSPPLPRSRRDAVGPIRALVQAKRHRASSSLRRKRRAPVRELSPRNAITCVKLRYVGSDPIANTIAGSKLQARLYQSCWLEAALPLPLLFLARSLHRVCCTIKRSLDASPSAVTVPASTAFLFLSYFRQYQCKPGVNIFVRSPPSLCQPFFSRIGAGPCRWLPCLTW